MNCFSEPKQDSCASGIKKLLLAGALSIAALMVGNPSRADTIETFSFTQNYYTNGLYYGTFTGTVDANGFITKDTLSAFDSHVAVIETNSGVVIPLFHFDLNSLFNDPSSIFSFYALKSPLDVGSLDIFVPFNPAVRMPASVCVGAAAAFGLCGKFFDAELQAVLRGASFGPGYVVASSEAPVITLKSSIVTGVPETSTWAMIIVGFAGIGLMMARRRKTKTALPAV